MILGVSHLAVRTAMLDRDQCALEAQGWVTDFVDRQVEVHLSERPFLAPTHPSQQTLAFMRNTAGLPALELVAPATGAPGITQASELNLAISGMDIGSGTLFVSDVQAAVDFFCNGLGFCALHENSSAGIVLRMIRPIKHWSFELEIIQAELPQIVPTLDCEGWFVLGVLVTDLAHDIERMKEQRFVAAIVPPFSVRVGDKHWLIGLCVLKSGFAIEMIQFDRLSVAQS